MKKTTSIFALLCILLNTISTNTTPANQKKQSLNFHLSGNSHRQEFIENEVTEVDIVVKCSDNSTIGIDIPLSVQKIQLTGSASGNSHIYLYARHNPQIINNISASGNSTFSPMHPVRKYTYHFLGAAALLGLAYYLKREK